MDKLSPERRSANMARIRSKNMKPERSVRSMLHRLGYRFRTHQKDLPGKPDIVFSRKRSVIFVHGCFWHQHKDPSCRDGRLPRSNTGYWLPKLQRNVDRDAEHVQRLKDAGWKVEIVWECEVKAMTEVQDRLMRVLGPSRTQIVDRSTIKVP